MISSLKPKSTERSPYKTIMDIQLPLYLHVNDTNFLKTSLQFLFFLDFIISLNFHSNLKEIERSIGNNYM